MTSTKKHHRGREREQIFYEILFLKKKKMSKKNFQFNNNFVNFFPFN